MAKNNNIQMTQETYDKLVQELENRKTKLRKEIAKDIAETRDLGVSDITENKPYAEAMDKKEMNENRIQELEDLLKNVEIVVNNKNDNVVEMGESVELEDIDSSKKRKVTLVGAEEAHSADPAEGKISVDSPIGKAIYKKSLSQIVEVELPIRTVKYKILKFV